jgi:hypothetical protein
MQAKLTEKALAVKMRKDGNTYKEILSRIPVSKSTLSLWLRDVGLAAKQAQRITAKKRLAQRKGATARREQRIHKMEQVFSKAKKDIAKLSDRDLWLIGTALYWGEGSKEKLYRSGQLIIFGNTDPSMVRVFVLFLLKTLSIPPSEIAFTLYVHEAHVHRTEELKRYWLRHIPISNATIFGVYRKKGTVRTSRRNTGEDTYYGTIRVHVRKSVDLQRRIQGWIYGITEALGTAR